MVRPLTPGREYVIDRSVMPICCVAEALGDTRGSTRSARAGAAPRAAAAAITPTVAANTATGDRRAGFMRQSSMGMGGGGSHRNLADSAPVALDGLAARLVDSGSPFGGSDMPASTSQRPPL